MTLLVVGQRWRLLRKGFDLSEAVVEEEALVGNEQIRAYRNKALLCFMKEIKNWLFTFLSSFEYTYLLISQLVRVVLHFFFYVCRRQVTLTLTMQDILL